MFAIRERGSTVGREVIGGVTTFMAMSYIIFVQRGLLGKGGVGMDSGGVIMATCMAAAFGSILMGLVANYPIALAPGMGENFFFAITIVPTLGQWGFGVPWAMGLALTAAAGCVFLLLSMVGFRSAVLGAIPDGLKSGIAAGIGLLIAVVGFNFGNLVVPLKAPGLMAFPGFSNNPVAWLTLIGLAITLALMALRVRGAVLWGILATAGVGWLMGMVTFKGVVAAPSGLEHTAGKFIGGFGDLWRGLMGGHAMEVLTFAFVLLFMDLFDTVGTLVGVAGRANLLVDGKLPRAERALACDAAATVAGAALGTTTVTSYIESVTGISAGARTGLAAVVAGLLMAAAIFFIPVVDAIGGGVTIAAGVVKYPLIAPALIVVGSMMVRTLREVDWEDATEAIPAFLTMITMPLTMCISAGIAIGLVSYAFGKIVTGRFRQCPVLVYVFAVLLIVRYVLSPDA